MVVGLLGASDGVLSPRGLAGLNVDNVGLEFGERGSGKFLRECFGEKPLRRRKGFKRGSVEVPREQGHVSRNIADNAFDHKNEVRFHGGLLGSVLHGALGFLFDG